MAPAGLFPYSEANSALTEASFANLLATHIHGFESAGIVLVRSDPRDVVGAIKLSRATYRKMIQNLVWATAYNLVAIPVAGGLLVRWGLDLPMSVGAVAMSLSTIIVAANAQLLRRLKLQRAVVVSKPAEDRKLSRTRKTRSSSSIINIFCC